MLYIIISDYIYRIYHSLGVGCCLVIGGFPHSLDPVGGPSRAHLSSMNFTFLFTLLWPILVSGYFKPVVSSDLTPPQKKDRKTGASGSPEFHEK